MAGIFDIQQICGSLDRGDLDNAQFLEQFNRAVAANMGCTRAGTWVLIETAEGRALRCVAMYDGLQDRIVGGTDILMSESPAYFDALLRDGCVVASDARTHPATLCFLQDYLLPKDIRSVLDVGFSVNGVLFGVFSCEQVGASQAWTQRQLQTLRQIGALASLTLMHAVNVSVDTAPGALWEASTPNRLVTLPMPLNFEEPDPPKE
jgi:GAF domain-containing protein